MAKENKKDRQMDIQAMMEVYAKLAIPGPPHKLLESMEGFWHTKTRCWTEPEKPPMESEGTCEQKMLLGGRFLQQVFNGDMMGKPFHWHWNGRVRQPYRAVCFDLDGFHGYRHLFF